MEISCDVTDRAGNFISAEEAETQSTIVRDDGTQLVSSECEDATPVGTLDCPLCTPDHLGGVLLYHFLTRRGLLLCTSGAPQP